MKYRFARPAFILLIPLVLFLFTNTVFAEIGGRDETIVIKSVIVNPSKIRTQKLPFKTYLPMEIREEHVLDAGDLAIDFDYQKGVFYAHKEIELKPGASMVIKIVLKDIWKIPEEEIKTFKEKSEKLLKEMEGTDYYGRSASIKNTIDRKLNAIERKRKEKMLTPNQQMEQYREVMKIMKAIQADIAAQEKIKMELKGLSTETAWKIIIIIMISLTLLSSAFFYLWYSRIRVGEGINLDENILKHLRPAQPPRAEKKSSKEDKKVDIKALESMLKKKE